MKKSKKSLLTLSVLGLGLLVSGCDITTDSTTSSSSSVEPTIVEVEKKFGVSVSAAEGTKVTFVNPTEEGVYSAGSVLSFTVSVEKAHLELDQVKYNGDVLTPDSEGVYSVNIYFSTWR